ncbi:RIC1-domain-containing [Pyrrhoderma noxium]|uniref:RIC1-domain-containing n=1 Tax=Pyrrhoderma noxium TaxID=2282107 RepID=A0A286URV0_9AGAM|nr:RIC1-domain-containing [Pyrrhoderma noxium]
MYFPTSTARQLSTLPTLPNLSPEPVIALCSNSSKSLFCTLTKNGLAVWRARPAVVLTYLSRTSLSLIEHGENAAARWAPDGSRILIQTNGSYLVLVHVHYDMSTSSRLYQTPPLSSGAQRHFRPGPGEAQPMFSVKLSFEGVIRVDGELLSVSPRRDCIIFSTNAPPAVQRIPWPSVDDVQDDEIPDRTLLGHDTWIINDTELPWLANPNVTITQISYSRSTGVETWIASDGRAYFVQFIDTIETERLESSSEDHEESESHDSVQSPTLCWQGVCIHDVEAPRWVQKQKATEDNAEFDYIDSRRAVCIAINSKFSLVATGTQRIGEFSLV